VRPDSIYNYSIAKHDSNVKFGIIKSYPELNCAAFKTGLDIQLTTWYQLQNLNRTGSGQIPYKDATDGLQTVFGYSQSTAYNLLNSGDGLFFKTFIHPKFKTKTISLFSKYKVAEYFKVQYLTSPILIDTAKAPTRKGIRAWLYASIFKTVDYEKPNHPISRKSLTEKTGLKTNRQQKYEKITPVIKTPNYTNEVVIYCGKSKEYVSPRQLGNTYALVAKRECKGIIKRINQSLELWNKSNQSLKRDEATDTKKPQRYFSTVKSFLNQKTKTIESFILLNTHGGYNSYAKC